MHAPSFVSPVPLRHAARTRKLCSDFEGLKLCQTALRWQGRAQLALPNHDGVSRVLRCATQNFEDLEDLEEEDDDTIELTPEELELCGDFPMDIPLINTVMLVGRLGRDPELKTVGDGLKVCNFSLAVQNDYDPNDPKEVGSTSWFDIEAWGRLGEYAGSKGRKGMRMGVTGEFGMNSWTGKDGEERRNYIVTATSLEVLDSKSERSQFLSNSDYKSTWKESNSSTFNGDQTPEDSESIDLPF